MGKHIETFFTTFSSNSSLFSDDEPSDLEESSSEADIRYLLLVSWVVIVSHTFYKNGAYKTK